MSFILDALKKSENERQRQIGPSLADVQTTRRLPDRPWWAVAVAALLVINLGVLVVVLMRSGEAKPAPATQAPAQTQAPAPETQTQSYNAPSPPARATRNQAPPPAATDPSVRSLADEAGGYEEPYPAEPENPNLAGAANVPARPPIVRQIAPPSVAPLPSGAVFEARSAGNASNAAAAGSENEILPTLNELTAAGTSLPELHLDIHVHSQKANERFVFVNMRKYLEGETLKEGPSVERITAEGVVLNQRGLRFLLPRQ